MAAPEVTAALKLRDDMSPGLKQAQEHVGSFSNFVSTAGATMVGFLGAQIVGNIGNFIKTSITARAAADQLAAQTNAAIKSTGGVANVTAGHIDELANSIKRYSGIDDDAIKKGENLLLTFTDLRNGAGKGNDIFDQTTKIMADMAVALGTDAAGSAIQLGKALNDPVQGISALQRVGVSFSQTQKDQIKHLQESGNLMGAQKIILGELSREFGGSAAAMGKSSAGMLASAQNAISDMQKALGGVFLPLIGLVAPKISDVANAAADWLNANQPLIDQLVGFVGQVLDPFFKLIGIGIGYISSLAGALGMMSGHMDKIGTVGDHVAGTMEVLVNSFGLAPEVVEKLATELGFLVDTVIEGAQPIIEHMGQLWREVVLPALAQVTEHLPELEAHLAVLVAKIRPVVAVIMEMSDIALQGLIATLKVVLPPAINLFIGLLEIVWGAVGVAMDTFMAFWTLLDDLFHGRWGKLWTDVQHLFATAVGGILGLVVTLVQRVGIFFGQLVDNIVGSKGSIPTMFAQVVAWFLGLPGAILNAVGRLDMLLWNAGIDMVKGMIGGIGNWWGRLLNTVHNLLMQLPQVVRDALGIHSPSRVTMEMGKMFTLGLQQGITDSWPGLQRMVANLDVGTPGGFGRTGAVMSSASRWAASSDAAGGGPVVHVHMEGIYAGDGPSLDVLANMITARLRNTPGT